MFLGNGQGLAIQSIGSSSFPSPMSPHSITLNMLLVVVPHIRKNLVSVRRFALDNHDYFEVDDRVLLWGYVGSDGLYYIASLSSPGSLSKPTSCSAEPMVHTVSTNSPNTTLTHSHIYIPMA